MFCSIHWKAVYLQYTPRSRVVHAFIYPARQQRKIVALVSTDSFLLFWEGWSGGHRFLEILFCPQSKEEQRGEDF